MNRFIYNFSTFRERLKINEIVGKCFVRRGEFGSEDVYNFVSLKIHKMIL